MKILKKIKPLKQTILCIDTEVNLNQNKSRFLHDRQLRKVINKSLINNLLENVKTVFQLLTFPYYCWYYYPNNSFGCEGDRASCSRKVDRIYGRPLPN